MYKFGFRPVMKSVPSRPVWERVKSDLQYEENDEGKFEVAWQHTFHKEGDEVFFAFCYPYSYSECQEDLAELERRLAAKPPKPLPHDSLAAARAADSPGRPAGSNGRAGAAGNVRWGRWRKPASARADPTAIFFHRELLARSLDGRRLDLVTISDWRGVDDDDDSGGGGGGGRGAECESHGHLNERLGTAAASPLHPSVFPEVDAGTRPHAPVFGGGKRVVFLSARVHPGETPASFCMSGALELLTHPTDARAVALRRHFVFKLVPILNPDGVARGHYRMDNFGRNLNRYYQDPCPEEQPTIYAAKKAALMHAFMPPPPPPAAAAAGENGAGDHSKNSNTSRITPPHAVIGGRGGGGRRGSKSSNNNNDEDEDEDDEPSNLGNRGGNLALYVDLHAHATKRGCFIYGNALDSLTDQTENQLYALLMSVNTAHFEYDACNFSAKVRFRSSGRSLIRSFLPLLHCLRIFFRLSHRFYFISNVDGPLTTFSTWRAWTKPTG